MPARGDSRSALVRSALRGAGAGVLLLLRFSEAHAASIQLAACQCRLEPGDAATVTLAYTAGPTPTGLLVGFLRPGGTWQFFSPGGLVSRPTFTPLAPSATSPPVPIFTEALTSDSLPFVPPPLVGPFRYVFMAALYDLATLQPTTPVATTFFDFAPRPPAPPPQIPGTLHLVPHHHNDIAWLDREDQYLEWGAEFIRLSVQEALRNPEYRFVVDQKAVIEGFAARHPELVDDFRQLVNDGRCELAGGFYVESDMNLLSGESLVRQAILGQRYLQERWGRRSRVAWMIDAFGHPHQMPQIAKKAGMDFYVLGRGFGGASRPARSEFYWESPDGSRVIAHALPQSYQVGRELGRTPDSEQQLYELFGLLGPEASGLSMLAPVGGDAHLQVFTPGLPELVQAWNVGRPPGVRARLSTPSAFFTDVLGWGALFTIRNTEFEDGPGAAASPRRVFPGAYGTRIHLKQTNQRLESQILDLEKLATVASLDGFAYPRKPLAQMTAWLAQTQTHDDLPGTGVDAVYDDPAGELDDVGDRHRAVERVLSVELARAAGFFQSRVSTAAGSGGQGTSWIVFNTMGWRRRDLVTVEIDPGTPFPARLLASHGAETIYQRIELPGGHPGLAFVADVPALGYTTYRLVPGIPATSPVESKTPSPGPITVGLGGFTVDLDGQGLVRRVASSGAGGVTIDAGDPPAPGAGLLRWEDDLYGNAYEFDRAPGRGTGTEVVSDVFLLEGPVMTRVITRGQLGAASPVVRETRLVPALERVDVTTTLDWHDVNKDVLVRFPFASRTGAAITEGVPYGYRKRDFGDYPALGWADFGNDAGGLAVLDRGLFAHRFTDEAPSPRLDLTVLRSLDRAVFGEYVSESMKEEGPHRFDYSLLPRDGTWRSRSVPRRAAEFGSPLWAFPAALQSGTLPAERSYVSLDDASSAILTVLQRDGLDVVARLYETSGEAGSCRLTLPRSATDIVRTNLLGDPELRLGDGLEAVVPLHPEEIVTLDIKGLLRGPRAPVITPGSKPRR